MLYFAYIITYLKFHNMVQLFQYRVFENIFLTRKFEVRLKKIYKKKHFIMA